MLGNAACHTGARSCFFNAVESGEASRRLSGAGD